MTIKKLLQLINKVDTKRIKLKEWPDVSESTLWWVVFKTDGNWAPKDVSSLADNLSMKTGLRITIFEHILNKSQSANNAQISKSIVASELKRYVDSVPPDA